MVSQKKRNNGMREREGCRETEGALIHEVLAIEKSKILMVYEQARDRGTVV